MNIDLHIEKQTDFCPKNMKKTWKYGLNNKLAIADTGII